MPIPRRKGILDDNKGSIDKRVVAAIPIFAAATSIGKNLVKNDDVDLLEPEFKKKVDSIISDLDKSGVKYKISETKRSGLRHFAIKAKDLISGNKTTWADVSPHQLGQAIDIDILDDNGNVIKDNSNGDYDILKSLAEKHDLLNLYKEKDFRHIQTPIKKRGE